MISKEYLQNTLRKIGVTRINSITRYDNLPIYVYQSCRPDAMHLCVDSGKGKTAAEAYLSCAVEAIERYTAENISNDIFLQNLENEKVYIPSSTIQRNRISDKKIKTYYAKEITSNQDCWIPKTFVDYRIPRGPLANRTSTGTTGLGAHSTTELAVCSGLVELIERDAIARGRYHQIMISSTDKSLAWIKKILMERSEKYAILRFTTNWPMEVVQIICHDPYVQGGMTAMGVGSDVKTAIEDAALEAMQTWVMRIAASRDDWAYSRVMDKETFDTLVINAESKQEVSEEEIQTGNNTKYTNNLYTKLLQYAREQRKKIYYVPIKSSCEIDKLKVVKVFIEDMNYLRQGPMLTGVPYRGY